MRLLSAAHASVLFLPVLKKTVEKREMNWIYVALVGLQITALMKDLCDVEMIGRRFEKFIIRKQRGLAGSHVGENHSSCFLAGICWMANRVPVLSAPRLSRLLQTATFNIIEPAVIETSQPAILNSPVAEICSSVGAVDPQKPRAPLVVTEQNQFFSENLYTQRCCFGRQLC